MTLRPSPLTDGYNVRSTASWALIIDDHPLFCDALEMTLRLVTDFKQVRTASCLTAALEMLEDYTTPSLILLDLNLPDVSGLDGLLRLKRSVGKAPVIIVSSLTDNAVIKAAIAAGASGFVPKHSRRGVFKEAIELIDQGKIYKPSGFVEGGNSTESEAMVLRLASLTNQQSRILELICEGKLNKQIAFDLSIAETTVKAHVTAIMRKMGVQSRTQAVLAAHNASFSHVLPKDVQSS